jgi:lipopolysaccharide/colanic/teichoic acid biosynthesis glycosyltransferase
LQARNTVPPCGLALGLSVPQDHLVLIHRLSVRYRKPVANREGAYALALEGRLDSSMVTLRRPRAALPLVVPADVDSGARELPPSALTSRRKRAFDIIISAAILIVTSPAWLIIAVAIKATSPGPMLFRQQRVGVRGRTFTMYKFRSMHHGASEDAHRRFVTNMIVAGIESTAIASYDGAFKLSGDARVTGVGRFLRRSSLDELPQLFNVLRGEMSLVGPRPPLAYEVERYEPWQHERLSVRPGITGLWQVSGRNRLSYVDMIRLDITYAREWTFRRDLVIALKTPWTMFIARGGAS